MSRDDVERQLQDFLDDRLREGERSAFESRLARDPDLRRRVEEARALGRMLREIPAELPAGFHRRARARYEAARAGRRRLSRLLSWEAAGLAVAALVLAVLLLPEHLRETAIATAPDAAPPVSRRAPTEATPPAPEAVEELELPREYEDKKRSTQAVGAAAERPKRDRDMLPPPPASPFPRAEKAEAGAREDADRPARRAEGFALSRLVRDAAGGTRSASLPAGTLTPRAVLVIEAGGEQGWTALLGGPAGPALASLDVDFSRERVVLIGPGISPSDCSFSVGEVEGTGEITITPAQGPPSGSAGGCAVVIPAGTAPVRLAGGNHANE